MLVPSMLTAEEVGLTPNLSLSYSSYQQNDFANDKNLPQYFIFYQVNWLNDYHEMCREKVGDLLHEQGKVAAYRWLIKETEPLG